MKIPRALSGSFDHVKLKGLASLLRQEPNDIALLFDGLSINPEMAPKSFNRCEIFAKQGGFVCELIDFEFMPINAYRTP